MILVSYSCSNGRAPWGGSLVCKGSWLPPAAPLLPVEEQPQHSTHLPPESAYFLACNRNKRSITVNFKSSQGVEILHKLVAQSDILVENFISGKLSEMRLGWDDCRKINERLIYTSITGKYNDTRR